MNFSQRLRELRFEKGVTQNELSRVTGLSHGCIAMLEVDKRAPTASTLVALADFFECSTDYLLGREDDFGVISIQNENSAPTLSRDGKEMLDIFNSLAPEYQAQILEYARYFAERTQSNRKKI